MKQMFKDHAVTATVSTAVTVIIGITMWTFAFATDRAEMKASIQANTDFRKQGQRFTKTDGQRLEDKIDEVIFLLKK